MVSIVPISPPRLKLLVAILFHCSARAAVSGLACASLVAISGMNALQLHQVISAVTAVAKPLIVSARNCGLNSLDTRGRLTCAAVDFQRSGSFTKTRTRKATAAGIRPDRNTYRQEISGLPFMSTPAI